MRYWEARALENDKRRREQEDECMARITRAYQACEQILLARIEGYISKYGKGNTVSSSAGAQQLTAVERNAYRRRIASLAETAATDEEYRQLQALIARVRISRQQALLTEIQARLTQLTNATLAEMEAELQLVYREQESHDVYDMSKDLGVCVNFETLAPTQLSALINTGYDGRAYSDKVWYNTDTLAKQLNMLLPRAFILGQSIDRTATEMSKAMNTSRYAAERLIRTEGAFLAAQADINLYTQVGIDTYEFLATLDDRTSEICRELDGKHFKRKDAAVGVNLPPMHPNCRSTTLPDVDMEGLDELRIAKDVNGNYITMPKMTYAQWAKMPSGEYVRKAYYASVMKYYGKPSAERKVEMASKYLRYNGSQKYTVNKKDLASALKACGFRDFVEFKDTVEATLDRLLPEAYTCMRVTPGRLARGLERGYFRPGHESRRANERYMFDMPEDAPEDAFPVYGLLLSAEEVATMTMPPSTRYGDILLVLKRYQITDRTTYTLGDSLNQKTKCIPMPLDESSVLASPGMFKKAVYEAATSLAEISAPLNTSDKYAEIQIRGGITLDDIAYVQFDQEPDANLQRQLRAKQISWSVVSR